MAIIWADSFDHYGIAPNGGRDAMLAGAWAAITNGSTDVEVSASQARTGTYSLSIPASGSTQITRARRVIGSKTVFGAAFGLYLPSLPAASNCIGFIAIDNASDKIFTLAYQNDGSLALYREDTEGVLLSVTDPVILAGSFNHVEIKAVIDDVVGSVEVRLNGIAVLNATDLDLGILPCTSLAWGAVVDGGLASPATYAQFIDDLVIWDDSGSDNNNFVGQQRVVTIFPVADTAVADWSVVGAGDGYEAIDDATPDGDTTYITAADVNDISEFELGTLPAEIEAIIGVYVPTMAKLSEAGTGNMQVSLVSGGIASLGPDTPLTTSYTYWDGVHERDPDTDAAWTKSGLEAALLRVEKTA